MMTEILHPSLVEASRSILYHKLGWHQGEKLDEKWSKCSAFISIPSVCLKALSVTQFIRMKMMTIFNSISGLKQPILLHCHLVMNLMLLFENGLENPKLLYLSTIHLRWRTDFCSLILFDFIASPRLSRVCCYYFV
jgi:hypothetical protein